MKKQLIRESFEIFINDPETNDILVDLHFDKLVELGLNLSKEEKREAFAKEIQRLIDNPPLDLYKDKKGRTQIREIQHYWDDLEDKSKYDYHLHSLNPIHKQAVFMSKKRSAIAWLKTQDKSLLMKKYTEVYG